MLTRSSTVNQRGQCTTGNRNDVVKTKKLLTSSKYSVNNRILRQTIDGHLYRFIQVHQKRRHSQSSAQATTDQPIPDDWVRRVADEGRQRLLAWPTVRTLLWLLTPLVHTRPRVTVMPYLAVNVVRTCESVAFHGWKNDSTYLSSPCRLSHRIPNVQDRLDDAQTV